MMIRLGVEAFLKKATAACAPPMCTLTCALARRRSCAAFSITAAVAGSSQKAWMVMRGIGRAREASCGGSAGARRRARSRRSSSEKMRRRRSCAPPSWLTSLAFACSGRLAFGAHSDPVGLPCTICPTPRRGARRIAASRRADGRGPRDWRPSPQDCAGWRSPCRAKACSADRGRYSPTNPGNRGPRRRTADRTAARAPTARHCRNTARARPSADDAGAAHRLAHLVESAHGRRLVGPAGRRPDQQPIGALRLIIRQEVGDLALLRLVQPR